MDSAWPRTTMMEVSSTNKRNDECFSGTLNTQDVDLFFLLHRYAYGPDRPSTSFSRYVCFLLILSIFFAIANTFQDS